MLSIQNSQKRHFLDFINRKTMGRGFCGIRFNTYHSGLINSKRQNEKNPPPQRLRRAKKDKPGFLGISDCNFPVIACYLSMSYVYVIEN